jgi:hypothetical protein
MSKHLLFVDFPEKFLVENSTNLNGSYHFDTLNIRTVLYYSNFIGIASERQRTFAIVFMRQMPQYILGEGSIEFDFASNRLITYISGHKPIPFAAIE